MGARARFHARLVWPILVSLAAHGGGCGITAEQGRTEDDEELREIRLRLDRLNGIEPTAAERAGRWDNPKRKRIWEEQQQKKRLRQARQELGKEIERWSDRYSALRRASIRELNQLQERSTLIEDMTTAGIDNDQLKLLKVQVKRHRRHADALDRRKKVVRHVLKALKGVLLADPDLPQGEELTALVARLEAEAATAALGPAND